ncbi:MAG: thymidine phosphorylase [Rothia sp. (in: high G+C Gram-positive bacteria)]|nr:thymidine phosphorylase [Rothia sp. (in: high G+C Gram-positive bacteria)]
MTDAQFDAVDIIRCKREGQQLQDAQIDWVIDAYTRGLVADEQMSALAMAIYFRGMSRAELSRWTQAMIASGQRMDFSSLVGPAGKIASCDKHSTGGVGDKITLVLAALLSVFGVIVPQLSGRGLGHTGGTLDKLEAIPGWQANLSEQRLKEILATSGAVICAASDQLAPADKKLYALRDVTATVESTDLIASSIMSKKIAEGTDFLILDVKVGSGAFMKDLDQGRILAEKMVDLGQDAGLKTSALLTNMDTPLGLTVGNACEVQEAVEVLSGAGPADVVELTLALAEHMLRACGVDEDPAAALADGRAMDSWRQMIRAQGGDPDAPLPRPQESQTVYAESSGILTRLDALAVGVCAWRLGAGRARKEEQVLAAAGVRLHAKPGDRVQRGQPLLTLETDQPQRLERALNSLENAFSVGEHYQRQPLILGRVESN